MFKTFLIEGLIKLPPKIVAEANRFFLEKLLAYLSYHGDKQGDELDQEFFAAMLKRFGTKYSLTQPTKAEAAKVGKSKVAQTMLKLEVPESYVASLKRIHKGRFHKQTFELKYIIVFAGKHQLLDGDESGAFIEDPPTMLLDIKNLGLTHEDVSQQAYIGAVKEVERRIEYALTTLEHELTHAVQFMILQQLHPMQVSGSGHRDASDKGSFSEVYYTSQREFDPQLKSALKDFEHLARRKGAKTKASKLELLRKYTWDDTPKANVPNVADERKPDRSPFFQSLKRVDQPRWKKALKLFTTRALTEALGNIELTELENVPDIDLLKEMVRSGARLTWKGFPLRDIWTLILTKHGTMTSMKTADYHVGSKSLSFVIGHYYVQDGDQREDFYTYNFGPANQGSWPAKYTMVEGRRTIPHEAHNMIDVRSFIRNQLEPVDEAVSKRIELTDLKGPVDELLIRDLINEEGYSVTFKGKQLHDVQKAMRDAVTMKTSRSFQRCVLFFYDTVEKEIYGRFWLPVGSSETFTDKNAVNVKTTNGTVGARVVDADVEGLMKNRRHELIDLNIVILGAIRILRDPP